MNVQLADHETLTREALRLTHRLFEEAASKNSKYALVTPFSNGSYRMPSSR